jgi:ABC-type transport system involved in multi-copper enzyme maturation permease subunit
VKAIYPIAKKEFKDRVRSKWIITLTLIFAILTIAISYFTGGGTFGGMEETVVALLGFSTLLVTLIAILLGYATISGEIESGSLSIVLAYPVKRVEALLGKFLGLGSVLVLATILGFGGGGIIIAANTGMEAILPYLAFICLTILLGLVYLSLSTCFSAICKKRVTSIVAGIVIFFWSMIYGTIILGIYLGTGGSFSDLMDPSAIPDWFWASIFLSPMDMNQATVMQAFGLNRILGFTVNPPFYINMISLTIVQVLWIITPLAIAFYFFKRRDV